MTPLRRLWACAVAVVLATGLGVATAPAASAVTCTYTADMPDRVAIDRPEVWVPVTLNGCPGYVDWADAFVNGPAGVHDYLSWETSRTAEWLLYDWDSPPGVYDTHDGEGWTTDGLQQTWVGDETVVKYGAWAGVRAARSGTKVTITAAAARYNATTNGRSPWANAVLGVQHCLRATGSCAHLTYVRTDASGSARITISQPATRYYRVYFGDTATHWGAVSGRAVA